MTDNEKIDYLIKIVRERTRNITDILDDEKKTKMLADIQIASLQGQKQAFSDIENLLDNLFKISLS